MEQGTDVSSRTEPLMREVLNYMCSLATKSWFRRPQDTKVSVSAYRAGLRAEVIPAEETKEGMNRIGGINRTVNKRNPLKP